jgi:rod shape-determining protein MreD
MKASRPLPPMAENALLLGLGVAMVLAAVTPLDPGGGLPAPDLVYGLVIAWTIRRPATTPLWIVLALGVFGDLMLARPVGLGALGLVLAYEWFRLNAARLHAAGFAIEWLAAAAGFAAVLAGMRIALELVFADAPGLGVLLRYFVATAIAYPLVVLGLTWCLDLRAPRARRLGAMGRLR